MTHCPDTTPPDTSVYARGGEKGMLACNERTSDQYAEHSSERRSTRLSIMSCVPYDEHIEPDEDAQKQTSLEQTVEEPGFDEIKSCEDFEKVCSLFRGFMLGVFWRQV